MATSYAKKTLAAKKPAPKKRVSKKPAAKKRPSRKPSLTTAQRAELLALDDAYEATIDHPVADTLQESRELEAIVHKLGKALYKNSKLTRKVGAALPGRRALLEAAEAAWTDRRTLILSADLRAQRAAAEDLKRDAIAALRHFREDDTEVQRRVDAIILGTGIADLIDDLNKLADLLEEHSTALTKAALPKQAHKRARDLAASLGGASADRAIDPEGSEAMALRNRAFWWLREAMDEIRSAGRYVYRGQPKLLTFFRASGTRARARQRAGTKENPAATPEVTEKPGP